MVYIYWLPTIQTEYHPSDSILCNFSIGDNYQKYTGNNIGINLKILIWEINIDFWWNVKKKVWK